MSPTGNAAASAAPVAPTDAAREAYAGISQFAIGFDARDRARLHELWDEIIDSQQWSHSQFNDRWEQAWATWNGCGAVAMGSFSGGAMAALAYAGVGPGDTVLCPSNTFMATPLTAIRAGASVQFVDSRRDDLCMSFDDFERKVAQHKPKAAWLVHIGGHIAFDVEQIAALCEAEGIFLIEDCAHAHGADWDGRKPGTWGNAGVYSFYATKTVSTGEGGMLVSRDAELLEYARAFRNYGKPSYDVSGLNYRASEFTAAVGLVQTERMEEIVAFKNAAARAVLDPAHPGPVWSCRTA